jgi:hypothetical protein
MNVNPETGQPMAGGSWFSRNWKWVVGLGCGLPLLCCLGTVALGGAGVFTAFNAIKENPVYLDVQKRLSESPQAAEVLGKPIGLEGFPITNIQSGPTETVIELRLDARGPKGRANVVVKATERDKKVTYSRFELITPQGEHVDLRDKTEQGEPAPEHLDPSEPAPHDPPMPDHPEDE